MITLATLQTASAQEVFNQVKTHLLTQKTKSKQHSEFGTCAYRSPDGLRCAAGVLIADDEYKPTFENLSWVGLVERHKVPTQHQDLIADLQTVHDDFPVEKWEHSLTEVAGRHGLTA